MSDNVYVNRDRSAVVPKGSADAKWQISREEAANFGLLESSEKPVQKRRAFDATKAHTAPQKRRTPKKG